jgi:hypothetical protein
MTTLEDLAGVLGGNVRFTYGRIILDTDIGGLRAFVVRRVLPLSNTVVFDLAVFTPDTRELDPFFTHREWRLDGDLASPRLGSRLLVRRLSRRRPVRDDVRRATSRECDRRVVGSRAVGTRALEAVAG